MDDTCPLEVSRPQSDTSTWWGWSRRSKLLYYYKTVHVGISESTCRCLVMCVRMGTCVYVCMCDTVGVEEKEEKKKHTWLTRRTRIPGRSQEVGRLSNFNLFLSKLRASSAKTLPSSYFPLPSPFTLSKLSFSLFLLNSLDSICPVWAPLESPALHQFVY